MEIKDKKKVLNHKIRKQIYYIILKYPGIHFNKLLKDGNFASGQLTHHLQILEKNNLIYKNKGKVVNYYSCENGTEENNRYLKYLRDTRKREIIKIILKEKVVPFSIFKKEIKLCASTLSWHLNELVDDGIILSKISKKKKYFFITKEVEEVFIKLLKEENKSVLSSLVDSFIDLWDENLF